MLRKIPGKNLAAYTNLHQGPGSRVCLNFGTVPYRNHDFYEELSVCVKETDTNGAGKSK